MLVTPATLSVWGFHPKLGRCGKGESRFPRWLAAPEPGRVRREGLAPSPSSGHIPASAIPSFKLVLVWPHLGRGS